MLTKKKKEIGSQSQIERLPSFQAGFGSVIFEDSHSGPTSGAYPLPTPVQLTSMTGYAKSDMLQRSFRTRSIDGQLSIAGLSITQNGISSGMMPDVHDGGHVAPSGTLLMSNAEKVRRKRQRPSKSPERRRAMSNTSSKIDKNIGKNSREQINRETQTYLIERLEKAAIRLGVNYEEHGHKRLSKHNGDVLEWPKNATLKYAAIILEKCADAPKVAAAILQMLTVSESADSKDWTYSTNGEQQLGFT